MKFSERWLREWVNPDCTSETLAQQLTMAGLEVDSVTPVADEFSGVMVGHIKHCERHPDADKLQICEVDIGEKTPIQIVTAATNVAQGVKVAVATIGAKLPGGLNIKKAKLRGVQSDGMFTGADNLGLGESEGGVLLFPDDAPIGQSLQEYLQLDDQSIDIDLTPNRGDCLSIAGLAREVGVLFRENVTAIEIKPIEASISETKTVTLDAPQACPQYVGRVIKGINAKAQTPMWMQEKLRRSGIRAIHPVVDVTNYVMFELGQPMHAFDYQKLQGDITVRFAIKSEKLILLGGREVDIHPETLVIADEKQAIALAGVMGGESTAVDDQSDTIFLESAFFAPPVIAGQARRYGLSTDSSHRYERGVDHGLQTKAIHRATELLLEIVGGQAGPIIEVSQEEHLPKSSMVHMRPKKVTDLLGIDIPEDDMLEILQRLGMTIYTQGDAWEAQVPTFRFDIALEVDLIEEIGRIAGYHLLPYADMSGLMQSHPQPESRVDRFRYADLLIDRGYHEVISYSFVDPAIQHVLFPGAPALDLSNPISPELSQMRLSLWPGLLHTLRTNQHHQQLHGRFFEIGMTFVPEADELKQQVMLSGLISGKCHTHTWNQAERKVDYFDLKGDVEVLLSLTDADFNFIPAEHSCLHPGQSAQIQRAGEVIGWMGALHPSLYDKLGVSGPIFIFELNLAAITPAELPHFQSFSSYPAVHRDLALVMKKEVHAEQVLNFIKDQHESHLRKVELFDVYEGEGIPEGHKSIAISLLLQHENRTLTEEEISEFVATLLDALDKKYQVKLRE